MVWLPPMLRPSPSPVTTQTLRSGREAFNPDAIAVLQSRLEAKDSEKFIFLNEGGNRLDDDNIYRNLKRILDNESIIDASPHTFRHSFASHLAMTLYAIRASSGVAKWCIPW